ncbi:MAG TPA: PhoH family protein, partial [Agitococcus sp.]|nr:PhoH family protein [Agitococcus sp.]
MRHLHLEPQQPQRLHALCGAFHQNIKQIEKRLGIHIHHRGYHFQLHGSLNDVTHGEQLLKRLYEETAQSPEISSEMVHLMLQTSQAPLTNDTEDDHSDDKFPVLYSRKGGIRPRGHNQANYVKNILKHDISFGVGPAGTGKTYLAVAAAVDQLEKDIIKRILLVRPAVEAGEKLGFLPGDLSDKIDPYLRPLYDALYEMLGFERVAK